MKRKRMARSRLLAQYVFLSMALTACGFSTTDELNAWLANERKLHSAASLPITAPRVFEAEAYELAGQIDPFPAPGSRAIRALQAARPARSRKMLPTIWSLPVSGAI